MNRGYAGRAGSMVSLETYMYSVCMIFLEGKDDREALIYTKSMCKGLRISLTVVHFTAPAPNDNDVNKDNHWETMLDSEVLKDVKYNNLIPRHHLIYLEKVVSYGSEMATVVKGMVDEYDLIIVGRSHAQASAGQLVSISRGAIFQSSVSSGTCSPRRISLAKLLFWWYGNKRQTSDQRN